MLNLFNKQVPPLATKDWENWKINIKKFPNIFLPTCFYFIIFGNQTQQFSSLMILRYKFNINIKLIDANKNYYFLISNKNNYIKIKPLNNKL